MNGRWEIKAGVAMGERWCWNWVGKGESVSEVAVWLLEKRMDSTEPGSAAE